MSKFKVKLPEFKVELPVPICMIIEISCTKCNKEISKCDCIVDVFNIHDEYEKPKIYICYDCEQIATVIWEFFIDGEKRLICRDCGQERRLVIGGGSTQQICGRYTHYDWLSIVGHRNRC